MATNARSSTPSPRGVVTFLLTDVEGSSRAWERDPTAMADAMARHDAVVDATIARHGGVRPPEQGEGDSAVAAFTHASDAVACALDLQRGLLDLEWPVGGELQVRLGLHTGEASPGPDGRYQGPVIVRCARLRDLAAGGQTLLSRSTHELVADGLPPGARSIRLGAYRLRGLARSEEVFALVHPALPERPAPDGALDRPTSNLPHPPSTFVGRKAELERVRVLLDQHRLVTLIGAGGAGKTRLAREAAAARLDRQPGDVCWVDLAPVGDAELVAATIADAMRLREVPGQPRLDTVAAHVGGQQVLLALDNCEHLIGEVAMAAGSLLQRCPQIVLLATSREPIGIEGEAVLRVPSMPVPAPDHAFDRGRDCDAVHLFVDRARAAHPDFELDERSWPALVSICNRLDGLPLALELAAARTRLLSLDQIADGLATSFALVAGGRRTALPRQQTLRRSITWSLDLLDETEQAVLLRTSVFAGGFDLDAAVTVCCGDGVAAEDVLDILARLVDKSLVQAEAVAGDRFRYRLLETIRHVAEERLAMTGDGAGARDRHLQHYLQVAEAAAPELDRRDQLDWLRRLDQEHDNLRSAAEWAATTADHDRELRLAAALWLYWTYRGHLSEARSRLEAALEPPGGHPGTRGWALLALADAMLLSGGFGLLDGPLAEALQLARATSDVRLECRVVMERGWAEQMTGDPRGLRTFEEAIALARSCDDDLWLSYALNGLGYLHCFAGRTAPAREALLEARALAGSCGNRKAIAMAAVWLGYLLAETGDLAAADEVFTEGCPAAEELGDPMFRSFSLVMRSRLETLSGDLDTARDTLTEAVDIARRSGNPFTLAVAHVGASWLYGHSRGSHAAVEDVVAAMTDAVGFAHLMGLADLGAIFLGGQGDAHFAGGDATAATACWLGVAERGRATDNPLLRGQACRGLALAAWVGGEVEVAERRAQEAVAALREAELWPAVSDALEILAAIWADMGAPERAARLLGATEADREGRGNPRSPTLVHHLAVKLRDLGSDELEPAREAGSAMRLEDAAAYASRGRGRRERPATGWASITPAEREVVALVAQGLTNPQIGERLFISRRTVQAHLGRVFAKLGLTSRTELAAEATRRSADEPRRTPR